MRWVGSVTTRFVPGGRLRVIVVVVGDLEWLRGWVGRDLNLVGGEYLHCFEAV